MADPTSLAQEAFRAQRDIFEAEFERFLRSLATPLEARRKEAMHTIDRLNEIGDIPWDITPPVTEMDSPHPEG